MRTAIAWLMVGVCGLGLSLVCAAEEPEEGYKVTSRKGGIAAVFPAKPKLTEQQGGEQYLLEVAGAGAYMLQYSRFEKLLDSKDDAVTKKVMDAAQESLLKAFQGAKLISSKDVAIKGMPAREFELDLGQAGFYAGRLAMDDTKLYHVAVFGKKDFAQGKGASKFRESVEFVEE